MKTGLFCLLGCLFLGTAAVPALGQYALPQLTAVWPPGGRQGTTVEVTLLGSGLQETRQLLFSHPGITAQPKMTPATDLEPARPVEHQFVVQIADQVPPGVYEVRAVGRLGLSNPRRFAVDTSPEVLDAGGNTSLEKAQALTPPVVLSGRLDPSAVDYYRLPLRPGQRVWIETQAAAIDSRSRLKLTLLDPQGREVAHAREEGRRDPQLVYTASADGDHWLAVADRVYGGGNDFFYRLKVSTAPHIVFVWPPFGLPGTTANYTLFGYHLPGSRPADGLRRGGVPLEQSEVSLSLPDDEATVTGLAVGSDAPLVQAWQDGIEVVPPIEGHSLPPVRIYLATGGPLIREQEPNDDPAAPQKLTVPCELAGQFFPEQDQDWFELTARKGETYWIEVVSQQWGLPTDPSLVVYRVRGEGAAGGPLAELAQADDPPRRGQRNPAAELEVVHLDPSYKFVAPEDGTYRLLVRDQAGDQRRDPAMVYRLSVRPPRPDFRLLAYPSTPLPAAQQQAQIALAATTLRRGGTAVIGLLIERRDELAVPVEVSVEGLPAGVEAAPVVLPPDQNEGALVLVAREDAPAWVGSIRVVGRAVDGERTLVRPARYASTIWGTANRQQEAATHRLVEGLQLAVLDAEPAPALVRLGEHSLVETALGGTVELPVTVARRGDFKGALQLTAVGLPQALRPQPVRVEGNQEKGKLTIAMNQANLRPGSYTVYLKGETTGKFVRNPAAVAAAEAEQKRLAELVQTLTAKLQAAKEAQDEPAAKALEEKLKQVTQTKGEADKRLDAVKKANPMQDTTFVVVSTPVTLRLHASPIALRITAPAGPWPPDSKHTLPVEVERRFGFKDKVDLVLVPPSGVQGLATEKISLSPDQTQALLTVSVAANATPGTHTCTVKASGQFNNIPVETQQTVTVTVGPP